MNQRKKKSVSRLNLNLTGRFGPRTQAIAIRQVRQWMDSIPEGDSICMRCESALPEKQFQVWKKWFMRHEDGRWEISDEHKSFFFYRSRSVE
jgi:ribosomal protein L37AE/L43A